MIFNNYKIFILSNIYFLVKISFFYEDRIIKIHKIFKIVLLKYNISLE